jgi:hypothetical protein
MIAVRNFLRAGVHNKTVRIINSGMQLCYRANNNAALPMNPDAPKTSFAPRERKMEIAVCEFIAFGCQQVGPIIQSLAPTHFFTVFFSH